VRWLGLDVGEKTIGLAISDEGEVVATPLRTLARNGGKRDIEAVAAVVAETEAGALLVGLPLDLSGREGEAARRVRQLAEQLERHLGCPVRYWDERFSTVEAERVLLEANMRRRRRKQVIDHVAASIILQGFLDSREGGRG
jgi:putative Holliday junction resolvase